MLMTMPFMPAAGAPPAGAPKLEVFNNQAGCGRSAGRSPRGAENFQSTLERVAAEGDGAKTNAPPSPGESHSLKSDAETEAAPLDSESQPAEADLPEVAASAPAAAIQTPEVETCLEAQPTAEAGLSSDLELGGNANAAPGVKPAAAVMPPTAPPNVADASGAASAENATASLTAQSPADASPERGSVPDEEAAAKMTQGMGAAAGADRPAPPPAEKPDHPSGAVDPAASAELEIESPATPEDARATVGGTVPSTAESTPENSTLPAANRIDNAKPNDVPDPPEENAATQSMMKSAASGEDTQDDRRVKPASHSEADHPPSLTARGDESHTRPEMLPPHEKPGNPFSGQHVDRGAPSRAEAPPTHAESEAFRQNNLASIVERAAISIRGEQSEARLALKPDHLGALKLQIATEHNSVSIRIIAETAAARDMLESHVHHLKAEMSAKGIAVERFDVFLADDTRDFNRDARQRLYHSPRRTRWQSTDRVAADAPEHGRARGFARGTRPRAGIDFFA